MSFSRLRSGRIHPDADETSERSVDKAPSLRSMQSQRSFRRQASGKTRTALEVERALAMTDEEHKAWLQDKVKNDARRGTMELCRFYFRMLGPVLGVALLMCGLYAAFSWSIPNLICNTVAKEYSGATFGLTDCVYIAPSKQGALSMGWRSKAFMVFFWTIQEGWMAGFAVYLTYVLFGPAFRKRERIFACFIILLCMCIVPVAGPRFGLSMMHMGIVLGVGISSGLNTFATANASARYTANPLMKLRWINLLMLSSLISNIYLFLIPMAITARSEEAMGGAALTFLRLIVHPALWGILMMGFRFFLRHCGYIRELRTSVCLAWPLIYSSLYGRFLLLQMEGMGSVVLVNLLFAFVELAFRLEDRGSDNLLLKILYGERARDTWVATRDQDERRMSEVFMQLMMELMSIFCASSILSLGGVSTLSGVPPDHKGIWISAAMQAATVLISEFVGMGIEGKFHEFEWNKAYTSAPLKLTLFIMFMLLIGGSRLCLELIAIFCPVYYPDKDIILLEQCDKPSLFQAITFSSANRFKMAGSFFNITTSDSVNSA